MSAHTLLPYAQTCLALAHCRVVQPTIELTGTMATADVDIQQVRDFGKAHSGAAAGVVNWTGKGAGSETKLGGLDTYVTAPKGPIKAAVLLVADVFGWRTDNTRVWADNLAQQGFLVVVPDFFHGNPRKKTDTPESIHDWRLLFPRQQVQPEISAVLGDIRASYPSVEKFGAVGFCWGGQHAVLLTGGPNPAVSAAVVYHGSLLNSDDILAINAPINFQQSDPELDQQIKPDFYAQIKEILADKASKGLDTHITYYPKQPHGYSLRGGSDPATVKDATAAFNAGAEFFKKHLL